MSDTVAVVSPDPVRLSFMVGEPDERAPGKSVLFTYVDGRRIARRAVDLADVDEIIEIAFQLRQLLYIAREEEPGIVAQIFALVADTSEEWKAGTNDEEFEAFYLGTIVRAREFRVAPENLSEEAVDHFAAIMAGKIVEPIDQMMRRLA